MVKMKRLKDGQSGFTLVELIIAIAIAAVITGGITAAIMQILTINHRDSNHMIAVRQVQQAGDQVSKDALQAQPGKIDVNPAGEFLTLNWTSWDGLENEIIYSIEDGELKRSHSFNGTPQSTAPAVVAKYIDATIDPVTGKARTNCVWNGTVLKFTVTAAVGTETETRIYEIEPRPDSL